ncbi:hypothetical protein AYO21_11786 [Fonsecaea monophora]|uniref:EKC/KEOPS complex subunit BUD32 n=1 Tax=Fonsecaea monophora TaxID=254056 RepID=A0A177ER11_9EURO|nr:hypothetical protein AYO21_11786 [Fonsecaea monophora]KAH0829838.1 EKC/KEOPS complex subunit BUD32 [Fonsecaea pedrosoi]OAG34066.1 hypothetical protein AYO21_11786 [Fonsecaea monophora]
MTSTDAANPLPPAGPHAPQNQDRPILPSPFHVTEPPPMLVTQGAEALLYRTHFLYPAQPAALKFRPSKAYRHPTLDARLTKQRVLAEARILVKLSALNDAAGGDEDGAVKVPAVLSLEWDIARKVRGASDSQRGPRETSSAVGQGAWLLMEWIEGRSVKDLLRDWDAWSKSLPTHAQANAQDNDEQSRRGIGIAAQQEEAVKKLLRRIGRAVGAMHAKGGVVHGDLTSSNIMIRPYTSPHDINGQRNGTVNGERVYTEQGPRSEQKTAAPRLQPPDLTGEIVLIDFGLATQSVQDEDRAVDLYVLERAFGSTHPRQEGWFDAEVLQSQEGYRGSFKGSSVVLKRLEEVRLRGRKRSMIG